MGIGSRLRARPKLASLFAFLILLGIGSAAILGSLLLDQRRAGRFLSQVLTRQLGVPVEVDRATTDGASRFILKGVRIPPGRHWSGSVTIKELRVEGGVLPFVAPSGRRLDVVAVSTRVALAPRTAPIEPPSPDTLASVRGALLRFLEWPATVSLEMSGGELHSEGETLFFDVRGRKASDGRLALSMTFRTGEGAAAFAVDAAGAAQGDSLILRVKGDGDPRRLGALWPSAVPRVARLTAQADLTFPSGPLLEISGRLTATPQDGGAEPPVTAGLAATYRAESRRVDLARLAVEWGPGITIALSGTVHEIGPEPRATLNVSGAVDGSRVSGAIIYEGRRRSVRGEVGMASFAVAPLLSRLGVLKNDAWPVALRAEQAAVTFSAGVVPPGDDFAVDGTLSLSRLKGEIGGVTVQAGISGRWSVRVSRSRSGTVMKSIENAAFTLTGPSGSPAARLTARTRREAGAGPGPWPLAVEATIADLGRLPPLPALTAPLRGSARVEGLFDWRGEAPLFRGALNASLQRVEAMDGQGAIAGLSATVPLSWGGGGEVPAGRLTAESVTAFGFALKQLSASARFQDGILSLSEVAYAHYGGTGEGWAEADLRGFAGPFRFHFEGEGIDLATLTKEYGLAVGRITGRVRYALALRYEAAGGLEVGGRVTSEPPGGEVEIDPLKTLLSKAAADPTGVLRATLENLSVFSYSSLAGEIRTIGKEKRVSLSLEGQKRFGIFPPRVRAINIQNVPLSLLVKTFGHPRRDSP